MSNKKERDIAKKAFTIELNKIKNNYMKIYDEYYSEFSKADTSYLFDSVNAIKEISNILDVYVRDGGIYSAYALEKLNNLKSIINSVIDYYEIKERELGE
jgi:hypothetical protein